MQTLYDVLVILHVLSWVVALVGWVLVARRPKITPLLAHGVTTAFVLGVILVGIASGSDAVADPNNAKVGVKLLVALAAVGLAHGTRRRGTPNPLAHVVAALIVVNVAIAYLWT